MLMVILRQGALFSIVTVMSWSMVSMMRKWDTINFCKSLVFLTVVGLLRVRTGSGPTPS